MQKHSISQGVALDEREKRGLTKLQMAEILGIEGANCEQIVTDFETGFRPTKGPALQIYLALNRARWAAEALLGVPRWTVALGDDDACMIHHNAWPRFVGKAFREELHPEQWRFKKEGMPVFVMDERTGYKQLVVAWVDAVPQDFDPEDVLEEGLRYLESKILEKKNG